MSSALAAAATSSSRPLAEVRADLEARLADVLRRHAKIDAHLHNADRELPADWSERAQVVDNDEVLEALDGHARVEATRIQAALRRLDAGTYGSCATCAGPVAPRRLMAIPWATQCIGCASADT